MDGLKLLVHSVSFILVLATIFIVLRRRLSVGRFPHAHVSVLSLSVHMSVFYFFVLLAGFDIFDVLAWISSQVYPHHITYQLWASAIKLQAVFELLILAISVAGREGWTTILE